MKKRPLIMLPISHYVGVNRDDPIRFYSLPIIGALYRKRVELCLAELNGGDRVLEIGFGSGVTFFNLSKLYDEIFGLDLTASIEKITTFFRHRGIETQLKRGNIFDSPYPDNFFDAVLLISILEHLKTSEQYKAFKEITRIVRPGGQVVYGVPVNQPLMTLAFRLLGYKIHDLHYSTEKHIHEVAQKFLQGNKIIRMSGPLGLPRNIYEVGSWVKKT